MTEQEQSSSRARSPLLTALPVGLVLAIFVVLVRVAALPLSNNDTFFHLRFGREFLSEAWSIRDPGAVSSFGTAEWVPTQWLPQLVMAQTEAWFGLPGVSWLAGLQFLTLALTLWWACRARSQPMIAALLTLVALVACMPGMSMRPQQISYILVVVTTAVWLRARDRGSVPWLLIPITWIWTMSHGMWPVGIVIGLVAVGALALDRTHERSTLLKLAAVPVASAAAALLTPVGPGLLGAVFEVNSRSDYFYEWAAPSFTTVFGAALLVLLGLALLPWLRGPRAGWFDIALVALAAAWGLYSLRTVPVAACMAAPLAAHALQSWIGPRPRVRRGEAVAVTAGYLASLIALAVAVPSTAEEPVERLQWLESELAGIPVGTPVLSGSLEGGYLMWRHPQLDLVMHGYGDVFTDAEIERNADIEGLAPGWYDLVRGTEVEYAVVDPETPLGAALVELAGWQVLEEDNGMLLLEPPMGWLDSPALSP